MEAKSRQSRIFKAQDDLDADIADIFYDEAEVSSVTRPSGSKSLMVVSKSATSVENVVDTDNEEDISELAKRRKMNSFKENNNVPKPTPRVSKPSFTKPDPTSLVTHSKPDSPTLVSEFKSDKEKAEILPKNETIKIVKEEVKNRPPLVSRPNEPKTKSILVKVSDQNDKNNKTSTSKSLQASGEIFFIYLTVPNLSLPFIIDGSFKWQDHFIKRSFL